jgi:ABC-type polysaccharide/polyol phosphate export permease
VESCDLDKRNVELPLKYNPIYGDLEDSSWSQFIQPGLIIMLTFVLSNVPGGLYVIEKRLGIVDRWTVAGVKFGHYVVACILSESIIVFGQIASLFIVLPYFYGMSVEGSWILAMAMTYSNALGGLGCGLLLGTLAAHEMEVLITLMLINSFNIISCGALWPLEAVRPLYRIFCRMMPSSLAIESLRSIVFRGWGLEHFSVWKGFLSSWSYAIVCIALCLWVHKKRKL